MSAESSTVGMWNICKVCTETLRDALSSETNLSSISVIITNLKTHETPEALLTCPVFLTRNIVNLRGDTGSIIVGLLIGHKD